MKRLTPELPELTGTEDGDRYVADNPDPDGENVAFGMRPEHWLSQDQGKWEATRGTSSAAGGEGVSPSPA